MLMHHHTLVRNESSIRRTGLLASKSRGKTRGVWLHTGSMMSWACRHLLNRRIGGVSDLIMITVDVPRSWLRRKQKGVYVVMRDIPADRIVSIVGYQTVAR